MSKLLSLAAAAALFLSSGTLHAATLLNDTFDDGTVAKTGALDAAWYRNDINSTLDVDTGRLRFLLNNPNAQTSGANKFTSGYFSGVTLSATGDYVELTASYQYDAISLGSGTRLILANSAGTQNTTNNVVATNINDDFGYGVAFNPGGSSTATASTQGRVTSFTATGGTLTFADVGSTFATIDPGADVHNFTLRITRQADNSLSIATSLSGVFDTQTVTTSTTPLTYTYDEIFLRLNGTDNLGPVFLDNVVVTTNVVVPEPASLAMLGLAGLGMLRRRAR